jgi:hypothetical protein
MAGRIAGSLKLAPGSPRTRSATRAAAGTAFRAAGSVAPAHHGHGEGIFLCRAARTAPTCRDAQIIRIDGTTLT